MKLKAPMRRKSPKRIGRAAVLGLSLVELMVAIGIGGLLIGGTIRIFVSNREAYEYNTTLSEVQDAGRIAMELMLRDIRHAGQFGCGGDDLYEVVNAALSPDDYANNPGELWQIGRPGKTSASNTAAATGSQDRYVSLSIEGFDGWASDATWLPSGGKTTTSIGTGATKVDFVPSPGTDGITVRYLLPSNRYTNVLVEDGTVSFTYADGTGTGRQMRDELESRGLYSGATLGVADCGSTHLFQTNSVPVVTNAGEVSLRIPASTIIDKPYGDSANGRVQLGQLVAHRYFVAPGRLDPVRPAGNDTLRIPTLFRERIMQRGNTTVERLVEGIEDLQILYGFDSDGNGETDAYVDAKKLNDTAPARPAVADPTNDPFRNFANVTSVRIALLTRSLKPLSGRPDNQVPDNFDSLGKFRQPYVDEPDDITFDCPVSPARPANSDPCRFRRRVFVGTAAVRNL